MFAVCSRVAFGLVLFALSFILVACTAGAPDLPSQDRQASSGNKKKKPIANASAFPSQGQAPKLVQFSGEGSVDPDGGEIVKWEWDFDDDLCDDDGGWEDFTSTGGVANHLYGEPGTYKARLRVTDDEGKKDTDKIKVKITCDGNVAPLADGALSPVAGNAPLLVQYSASGSSDSDGFIVKWEWDLLGDDNFVDFTASEGVTSLTYNSFGALHPVLRVTDDNGATAVDSLTLFVNTPPQASLVADPVTGTAPLLVNFDANASLDAGGIVKYEWDFNGDGEFEYDSGAVATATYEYADAGSFNPSVRVTDAGWPDYSVPGLIDTASVGVEVEAEEEPEDWSTFGHDTFHTHRSPFAGPATSAVKWTYNSGDDLSSSVAMAPDGTLYVGGDNLNFKLIALNPDGTLKWTFPLGLFTFSTPAVAPDGTVYIGCADHKLYAVNPDGTLQWSFTTGAQIYSSPTIGPDGMVYFGSWDKNIYALNPDGSLLWSYPTGHFVYGSPTLAADGTVYAGSRDGKLYAINPDGTPQWTFNTGGNFDASAAIQSDGTVIAANSVTKRVYALNPDGSLQWSYLTGGRLFSSPALDASGRVFVGADDGKLYALNPDGTLAWTFSTAALVFSSPAVDSSGRVFFGSDDKTVYALNSDGTLLWSYLTGGIVRSSPAIAADGSILISSHDNLLYAFGPGSP